MSPLQALATEHLALNKVSIFKGKCSFCSDSREGDVFYVYANHYHCFACGAHGDEDDFRKQMGLSP
jgi:DNA primase